jgi:cbb3-type cytochrome oxidase maturation protein
MTDFLYLVPIALGLGLAGLAAFMWAMRSGQYDDLDGAAERILLDAASLARVMVPTPQSHARIVVGCGPTS